MDIGFPQRWTGRTTCTRTVQGSGGGAWGAGRGADVDYRGNSNTMQKRFACCPIAGMLFEAVAELYYQHVVGAFFSVLDDEKCTW